MSKFHKWLPDSSSTIEIQAECRPSEHSGTGEKIPSTIRLHEDYGKAGPKENMVGGEDQQSRHGQQFGEKQSVTAWARIGVSSMINIVV